MILAALVEALRPGGIVARDEIRIRAREGLAAPPASVVYGEVSELVEIREGVVRYLVDPCAGQKTGFFLDQRDKRRRIGELSHAYPSLLNCFSYTGGFALAGLAGNPELRTVNVDSSGAALDLAKRNYTLNGHDPAKHSFEDMDVTRYLQQSMDRGRSFGIVALDPPAFAKTARDRDRALRAYENLNTLGARAVSPDGLLLTCSCSGAITYDEFEGAVRAGLLRAERQAQIIESFTSSLDHPTLPAFPEDRYLKALLLRLL
jgi:23S rRNA (cytosine1962-C5)-methyltransferase